MNIDIVSKLESREGCWKIRVCVYYCDRHLWKNIDIAVKGRENCVFMICLQLKCKVFDCLCWLRVLNLIAKNTETCPSIKRLINLIFNKEKKSLSEPV